MNTYHAKRRLIQLVSTLAIIILPFLNVFRLDIPTLRFYFINTILWVDEFYLLFMVLMLVLWVIVIFSMLYGRVWCGWMCPQTVLNEIIHWVENKTKKILKFSREEKSLPKRVSLFMISSLTAIVISGLVGFNLVAYFVDPYRMISEIFTLSLGKVTGGIILGLALLIYVDMMFWREKFCTRACPYGMMQFVITDEKTQIVRYQTERETDCIDCKACVRDCMMGIDIRESPYQTECIQCGECVDACSAVLGKLKEPKPTLITYAWGEKGSAQRWYEKLGFLDAKRWIVLGITVLFAVILGVLVQQRQPLSVSVSGDRSTLYRQLDGGSIYNDYKMRISNRSLDLGFFEFGFKNGSNKEMVLQLHIENNPLELVSREVRILKFSISSDGRNLKPGPNKIILQTRNTQNPEISAETEVIFFMPEADYSKIGMQNSSQKKSLN